MNDVTELFLGALAVVLGGGAFALGGQVLRDAWRGGMLPARPLRAPAPRAPAVAAPTAGAARRLLRAIAVFEAFKGLLAIAAVAGLLGLVHHDLRHAAAALIGHIGLRPGGQYPMHALAELGRWGSEERVPLLLAATGYAALRFGEAYGLWRARPWGERLGAWSGALYVPVELWHLLHRPGWVSATVLAGNIAVIGFLAWRAWGGAWPLRQPAAPGASVRFAAERPASLHDT